MANILDLIQQKQKEMAAKKSRQSTLKPAPGDHKYRILPSWRGKEDGQFWHDMGMHFIRTESSGNKPAAVYICADKTFGKPCEVCDAITKSMAVSGDDKMTEYLKQARSSQRYLMNVLHLTGTEPNKVQVLEVGQGVFQDICNLIAEYGDITDPEAGIDIKIKREGSGLDTEYSVLPAAKSGKVDPKLLSGLVNLDEWVAQENPAGHAKALTAVGAIIGVLPPADGRGALPSTTRAALADMSDDAEDADFTPVRPTSTSSVTDADLGDLDELDELLGD